MASGSGKWRRRRTAKGGTKAKERRKRRKKKDATGRTPDTLYPDIPF
jgi:hypothetical protein